MNGETLNAAAEQVAFQAGLALRCFPGRPIAGDRAAWTGRSTLVGREGGLFVAVAVEMDTAEGRLWAVQAPHGLVCSNRLAELAAELGRQWS